MITAANSFFLNQQWKLFAKNDCLDKMMRKSGLFSQAATPISPKFSPVGVFGTQFYRNSQGKCFLEPLRKIIQVKTSRHNYEKYEWITETCKIQSYKLW